MVLWYCTYFKMAQTIVILDGLITEVAPLVQHLKRLAWGKVHCGGSSHWASCEPSHIAVEHRHRCWGHHVIISSRYECWVLMAFFTKETTFLSSISLRVKTLRGLVFTFVVGEPVGVTFSTGLWMSFLSCNDNLCTSMYKRFRASLS